MKKGRLKIDTWSFTIRDGGMRLPYAWNLREGWCARLYYNASGAPDSIPSSPDGSPAAKIRLGIGVPIVAWGPFLSIRGAIFNAGGLTPGAALAFGNSDDGWGQRVRRYGCITELTEQGRSCTFKQTKNTIEAVQLSEEIRAKQFEGQRQIVGFNTDHPMIAQLRTLAQIWGGPEVLAVALDWLLDHGQGGGLLPLPPPRTPQIGDRELENRERFERQPQENWENPSRMGALIGPK
jgi:hypothetical protein